MDPHHVRYFLAVVDQGSVNAAAGAVGVAQPTISQALRALERELRTPLFHRIGRGMVPTSAGHALVGPARKILRDMATAAGFVPDSEGQLRGHLDVLCHPALGTGLVPQLVAAYHRLHPRVGVTIGTLQDEGAVSDLLQDAVCEVVITHLPFAGAPTAGDAPQRLEVVELGSQEYWVAYPPDAEAPPHDPMAWDELDAPMVTVPQGGRHAEQIFREMTPEQQVRRPAVILQNREARLAFTLAGVGATWIERSQAEVARSRGAEVRALEPALPARFGLVFEPATLSPAASAFVSLARGYPDDSVDGPDDRPADRPVGSAGGSTTGASAIGGSNSDSSETAAGES